MDQQLDIILRLTERRLPAEQRKLALYEFADSTGWRPSDALIDFPGTEDVANGHLVAEHGLERSAVISFLQDGATFEDLSHGDQTTILSISYNNLIDWHLFPDRHGLTVVFNRGIPITSDYVRRRHQTDLWRVDAFDAVTGRRATGKIKALDDALIETVSHWRRSLAAELGPDVPNHAYAALFNGIILIRAAEDLRRYQGNGLARRFLSIVEEDRSACRHSIESAMSELRIDHGMTLVREILDELSVFNEVDITTWIDLVRDFYSNRFAPYQYDFFLISKQALSRVYEKYVSVLRTEHSPQLSLFAPLPSEQRETPFGEVYTPQYIARFFARFLKEEFTPREFRSAKTLDPACGSGIFLRSVLELQCDPHDNLDLPQTVATAFANIAGADIDPNACFATRLSLSLLHLILADSLPSQLKIIEAEALEYFLTHTQEQGSYDAVIANPPFVRWDNLTPLMRERITVVLGDEYKGKIDLFSAFLTIGLELVRPGGYLMFVLPHSFLLSSSSEKVRRRLADTCTVRVLADLSEVPVFEGIGAYVVLLICQKKDISGASRPPTMYARVRDYVGHSLQAILKRQHVESPAFEVYEVPSESFSEEPWLVLPQRQQRLIERLRQLPRLGELCSVQQGIVTGADAILIRDKHNISRAERSIWKPLLRDRDMSRYRLGKDQPEVVFYPFEKSKRLDEVALSNRFPNTWDYLVQHKTDLEKRAPVRRGNCQWWEPAWPRKPDDMFGRAKLVAPHLSITPRFGFDAKGQFAVTRSPMIFAKDPSDETSLLKYVAAMLNSTVGFWQVVVTSHKYRSGYAMLEKKSLMKVHLPHPTSLDHRLLGDILSLVDQRLSSTNAELDPQIDSLVADAYGLSASERAEIGLDVQ